MQKMMDEGIPVNISTVAEIIELCNYVGLDSKKYIGDICYIMNKSQIVIQSRRSQTKKGYTVYNLYKA